MTNGGTQRRSGGVRAFMIADLRGYTSFTEQQGDEASAVLTERFADVARAVVESREGTVVETRGDEVLAEFGSPRSSVRAALDLHLAIAGGDDLPLQAGIGLDVGEAVPVGDGFRGRAINMAARLCARAKPGETSSPPSSPISPVRSRGSCSKTVDPSG
jgi:adenylate cyclase